MRPLALTIAFLAMTLPMNAQLTVPDLPRNPAEIKKPVSYAQVEVLVDAARQLDRFTVREEGKSVEGRTLYSVTMKQVEVPTWEVLFIGCQHGNEHSGKDAIAYMLWDMIEHPEKFPEDVAVHLIPNSNPDGSEADRRINSGEQDLNRDHQHLSQPETRVMHQVVARLRPHVVVDCHEFARDSGDYLENGWLEWPLIMMDTANHPYLPESIYSTGKEWVHRAQPLMDAKGINYHRYYVGGTPPHDEQRYSTLDADDARNGLATYGGLGFIIEAGIQRRAEDPFFDLNKRVEAYHVLLNQFLHDREMIERSISTLDKLADEQPAEFIPTNFFWARTSTEPKMMKVIDRATGETKELPIGNFMEDRVVKSFVPKPTGYIVHAAEAEAYATLLEHKSIPFEKLAEPLSISVEPCTLVTVEADYDELYSRYEDRQIVKREKAKEVEFPAGSLKITLDGEHTRRAVITLEPTQLYGLYQRPEWRKGTADGGILPVYRIP